MSERVFHSVKCSVSERSVSECWNGCTPARIFKRSVGGLSCQQGRTTKGNICEIKLTPGELHHYYYHIQRQIKIFEILEFLANKINYSPLLWHTAFGGICSIKVWLTNIGTDILQYPNRYEIPYLIVSSFNIKMYCWVLQIPNWRDTPQWNSLKRLLFEVE